MKPSEATMRLGEDGDFGDFGSITVLCVIQKTRNQVLEIH